MKMVRHIGYCENPTCVKKNAVIASDLYADKKPRCESCIQPLKVPRSLESGQFCATDFYKKVVELGLLSTNSATPEGKYINDVILNLSAIDNEKFRDDFIKELKKEEDLKKFTGLKKRSTAKRDICVDNALAAAGISRPTGCPEGEKFTFEVPYIMAKAGWTPLDICQSSKLLTTSVSTLYGHLTQQKYTVNKGYFFVWTQLSGNTESHMVYLVVEANAKRAYIHDPQKQNNNYASGFCEVWVGPGAAGASTERKSPYCDLTLPSGKLGDWI